MPPKPKYTKDEIIAAALEVVSEKGADALTAKELGYALNTSTTPIFTVFNSMKEVRDAVKDAAMKRFESYAHKARNDIPVFKQIGMQMIMFAKKEPQLYRLVFMSPDGKAETFDEIYTHLGTVADECIDALQTDNDLSRENAKELFEHIWIYTFGIGALCATGMCDFSEELISQMLTQNFTAMLALVRTNKRG